mgnify:FL=1
MVTRKLTPAPEEFESEGDTEVLGGDGSPQLNLL